MSPTRCATNRRVIRFSLRGASGKLSTVKVPRNSFNDAVTQLVISLLIVCVRFLWEVDKVEGPFRESDGQPCPAMSMRRVTSYLAGASFDAFACSGGELRLGDSRDDLYKSTSDLTVMAKVLVVSHG